MDVAAEHARIRAALGAEARKTHPRIRTAHTRRGSSMSFPVGLNRKSQPYGARDASPEEKFRLRTKEQDLGYETPCMVWTGYIDKDGYGKFTYMVDGKYRTFGAHRWAYDFFVRPLDVGEVPDHLCGVRHCVNVQHLDAVQHGENSRRGRNRLSLLNRDVCSRGHPVEDGSWRLDSKGTAICLSCQAGHAKKSQSEFYERCLERNPKSPQCIHGHVVEHDWKRCKVCHRDRERLRRNGDRNPNR